MSDDTYIPYGDEWRKEVKKMTKDEILDSLLIPSLKKKSLQHQYRELIKWKEQYNINLQLYNKEVNIYVSREDVELFSTGGHILAETAIETTLNWLNKVNPQGLS